MKKKELSKKLTLIKETVTNLDSTEQKEIKGGAPNTSWNDRYNCYTRCDTGICCEFTIFC